MKSSRTMQTNAFAPDSAGKKPLAPPSRSAFSFFLRTSGSAMPAFMKPMDLTSCGAMGWDGHHQTTRI